MLASQLTAADAAQPDAIEKARKTMLREQREAAIAAKMKGSAFSASLTMATPPPSGRPRPSSKDRRKIEVMSSKEPDSFNSRSICINQVAEHIRA